jgi:hypothetical protein
MMWWLLVALMIVVSCLLCRFVVSRARRYRRWLATLLCFTLPPVIAWVHLLAAEHYADRYITCNAPDCGAAEMIALGSFAMSFAVAGLIGAIAGVLWGVSLEPLDPPRD